jgi:S1-C subfamily serine protease
MDDFLRRFFGDQSEGRAPRRNNNVPRQQGVGSGVIATKDGYILTNNHVVDGADEVKVALQDGREFTAKVIGRDPKSDVAVIKIEAKDLPAVTMADSDKVEVGDIVLAVGNPFGIGQTVTTGIVSATGRSGAVGLDYEDFIQTDAAINPGNSVAFSGRDGRPDWGSTPRS